MDIFGFLRKKEVSFPTQEDWAQQQDLFQQEVAVAKAFLDKDKQAVQETKECSRCFIRKPLSDFNKQAKSKDGCGAYCKECNKQYVREYFEKNKLARLADNVPPALPKVEQVARIQHFLEDIEPPIHVQLQDLLDDLDILVGRVATLQARVNQLENPRKAPVAPMREPHNPPRIPGDHPVG